MKNLLRWITIFTIAAFSGCDDIGGIEKSHSIPSDSQFLLPEGDTLVYRSGARIEKFTIAILVNGKYSEYRSGTCGKGARDIIDFQAVTIKSVDSLEIPHRPSAELDDCDGPPGADTKYINIIKNLVHTFQSQGIHYDASVNWYNDFRELESASIQYHKSISLNNQQYNAVYEYEIKPNTNSNYVVLYYTKHYGFVGYKLKNGDLYNLIEPVIK